MLAACCQQLRRNDTFWQNRQQGDGDLRFATPDIETLYRTVVVDAFGEKRHFRPLPFSRASTDGMVGLSGLSDAPDSNPDISLIDQLLSCDISQGFAALGDWYQNSSLTVKTDEGTAGHH